MLLSIFLLLMLPLPACQRTAPPAAPVASVLFLTLDTTRADHLSAYGYTRPTSPSLEQLASLGVRFTSVYTPVNLTTASHATLFTSQPPTEHGVRANVGEGYRLSEDAVTLAEVFRKAGYTTGAFVAAYTAGLDTGLAQGFDVFREPDYHNGAERRADEVVDEALTWIDAEVSREQRTPLFLWVHLFDPHGPYDPPGDFGALAAGREAYLSGKGAPPEDVHRYDGEIRFADSQINRLLVKLNSLGPNLVSIAGDHGETLTERPCGFFHGHNLFQEQVRVPWLLAGPNLPKGKSIATALPTQDIAPTVLGALGLRAPASFRGRNLLPFLRGGNAPPKSLLFLENGFCDPKRCSKCAPAGVGGKLFGVFDGRFKLVRTPTAEGPEVELFDLQSDPSEKVNVASAHPETVRKLLASLDAHFSPVNPPKATEIGPYKKSLLKSIGYTQ